MEGYLSLRINPILRRLITRLVAIVPALIVILIYGESKIDTLLIMSQVILSLQLGFAIIPLIWFVSDKKTMGNFAINPLQKIAAWVIAGVLVFLNLKMLINEVAPVFAGDSLLPKIVIGGAGTFFSGILVYITLFPFFRVKNAPVSIEMHEGTNLLQPLTAPIYNKIAVALDFSINDHKILSYATGQGNVNTNYVLIHVVESASAKLLGEESDDHETKKDIAQLQSYAKQLKEKGKNASAEIGYRSRVKEIVRIVNENNADLLVIGAHGHSGMKDILYGQTVNAVRHELKIPVLIVTL